MSAARQRFLSDVEGVREALALDPLSAGALGAAEPLAVVVLRRGILVASFIALETFIRQRCVELLGDLTAWPGSFEDFPQKFRDAALFNSVSNLQKFAQMLKRQSEDYEREIIDEVGLIAGNAGPVYSFSRHMVGDFTGNVSSGSLKDLLAAFVVKDCWNGFRVLASDTGFGVPSVEEIFKGLARKRHRSAHVAGFSPTLNDTQSLPAQLTCLGLCVDASLTASVSRALSHWEEWRDDAVNWRQHVRLFLIDPRKGRFAVSKKDASRALKIGNNIPEAINAVPVPPRGEVALIVTRDASSIPISWTIVS